LQLALTDAPGDGIEVAVVSISEIYLQSETEGRVVLRDTPVTVDLVTLANSTSTIVDAEIPDGVYGELRFVIDGAWIETTTDDGGYAVYATPGFVWDPFVEVTGELKTPSWDTSGLKIKIRDELVVDGTQKILLVDFDVAESFQTETGNGAWVMHPVVTAYDIGLTTGIDFTVYLGGAVDADTVLWVELYDAEGFLEGTLLLTDADGDGVYTTTFLFLDPAEGPFTAHVVTIDGEIVVTVPTSTIVVGQSGITVSAEIDVIGIVVE
jgi:hypothetical protein